MYRLGERRSCRECGKSIVYSRQGWFHVRATREAHIAAPLDEVLVSTESEDMQRIAQLQEVVKVQAARIQTLLAENAKLAEKVKK